MASEALAECSLNTTECILETIASILCEIQEQNDEYNWDPLTFVFTGIIGIIAILFAALTAFQSFLAAGPGRTKSGYYAIGHWSQLNRRKFDFVEMRFRTTVSTPILTIQSLNFDNLKEHGPVGLDQGPLRPTRGDYSYYPATWLALLTHLSLNTVWLWDDTKFTGADFIPSEFPAVPAYGSIRFVVTLAMILSRGRGRLTIDRESGLPKVRDRFFNLIFRQHPLLGAIGFFEMYGRIRVPAQTWRIGMRKQLLQTHGYMSISEFEDTTMIEMCNSVRGVSVFNRTENEKTSVAFRDNTQRNCPHSSQTPKPACLNALESMKDYYFKIFMNGPLVLLVATIPEPNLVPCFFPHKKNKLSERLDTLLLQSRFWGTRPTACCDHTLNNADDGLQLTSTAASWAKSKVKPDIDELKVEKRAYKLCWEYLTQSSPQKSEVDSESRAQQLILLKELRVVDSWLKDLEAHAACRILTLSTIGDGIQQMINTYQQQPILEVVSSPKTAIRNGIVLPLLHNKLSHFLEEVDKPNSLNRLYSAVWTYEEKPLETLKHDTSEGLRKIQSMWEMEESYVNNGVDGSQDGTDGNKEHNSRAWKFPSVTVHPLDDVLIYRAVLLTLIYCLSHDSSVLMDDAYDMVVPIM